MRRETEQRDSLGTGDRVAASPRPEIIFREEGNDVPLHQLVPRACNALAKQSADRVFVRRGKLVRVTSDLPPAGATWMRGGGLRISVVPESVLCELLDESAAWIEIATFRSGPRRLERWAPKPLVKAVKERGEWPGLRHLVGVVEAPTLRPDGSVLCVSGYDEATGLLYEPARDYPSIPDRPTDADVRHALRVLLEPFAEFRFEIEADRASLLALMLTIAARPAIDGPVPHWAVIGPVFGAGKTLLVEAATLAMTGLDPDKLSPTGGRTSDAEAEMRKRVTTLVLEASRVAMIDNVRDGATFESKSFAALLTTTEWTDRILGKNEKVRLPHSTVWASTGCNYRLHGDLVRRSLSIVIDPGVEEPHRSRFRIERLDTYVREHHPELLTAALTIARAFFLAGRPRHPHSLLGKFEGWDLTIRAMVIWGMRLLGQELDPLETAERLQEEAPDRGSLGELMEAWKEAFHDGAPRTVREVIERASDDPRLWEAIIGEGGAVKGEPNSRALGNRLRVAARRVVSGRCFRQEGKIQGATRWSLEEADGRESRESRESEDNPFLEGNDLDELARENSRGTPTRLTRVTRLTDSSRTLLNGGALRSEGLEGTPDETPGGPRGCFVCGGTRHWRLRSLGDCGDWMCERCQRPLPPEPEIEWRTEVPA